MNWTEFGGQQHYLLFVIAQRVLSLNCGYTLKSSLKNTDALCLTIGDSSFIYLGYGFIVIIQSLGRVQLFATPWTVAHQASLSFTISQSLLKLMSIESVMPSKHIICHLLLLLPSAFPSIRVFSSESVFCIRLPKHCSFSYSSSPSNEYSGISFRISFRTDWFDLHAAEETLKSLLQHHNTKASFLWCSVFFLVQLTLIHHYWENHIFDQTDICQQSNVSVF